MVTEKTPTPYGGRGRPFSPSFLKYMTMIVGHPNYKGMPWAIDDEGKIRWNAPSHRPPGGKWSNLHDERLAWWEVKAKEIGVSLERDWISRAAKAIHPTKRKPCQTCARDLSLLYEYPTKRTIKRINNIPGIKAPFEFTNFLSILDIIPQINKEAGQSGLLELCSILGASPRHALSSESLRKCVQEAVIPNEPKGVLSPGAMSDAPDRLDGFHTYNICCRPLQDTGRGSDNLRTYGVDRRAFELWCEGDWAAADYVMKQRVLGRCAFYSQCGFLGELTADHIGPISLGFCHRPKFRALCRTHNSARNNKLSHLDVRILLEDESGGDQVVSWHAKEIWDTAKRAISDDSEALELGRRMRANQHHFLVTLAKVKKLGRTDFLKSLLHPEHALNKYRVMGFGGTDFSFDRLITQKRADKYAKSKMERLVRIALTSLDQYAAKDNRNPQLMKDEELRVREKKLLDSLAAKNPYSYSRKLFEEYMTVVANRLITQGVPRSYQVK